MKFETYSKPAQYAISGVAGFAVANRFVPNTGFFGKYNDVAFGVAGVGLGLATKNKHITAFGVGATVEGVLVLAGL